MQLRWRGARLLLALAPALAQGQAGRPVPTIDDRCNDLLKQALENKNPDTRKQAVVALSLAATDEPAFGRLEGMLQDKDVEVRLVAVASLAEVKTDVARAALRQALEDDVPEVSFAAAKALWVMQDPVGEQALLAVLGRQSKTASNYISKQKRDALRMLQTPRVLFIYAFRQGIGFVPVPGLGQGISSMTALLTDPGVSGRATAALLLGKDKSAAVLDALKDALLDLDWSVRAAAVHSLALRDDPALKRDLEPLLDDDKAPVRLRAAAGILRLSAIEEKEAKKKQRKASARKSAETPH